MESSYRNSNSDLLWKHVLRKVFSGQLSGEASLFSSSFFPERWEQKISIEEVHGVAGHIVMDGVIKSH